MFIPDSILLRIYSDRLDLIPNLSAVHSSSRFIQDSFHMHNTLDSFVSMFFWIHPHTHKWKSRTKGNKRLTLPRLSVCASWIHALGPQHCRIHVSDSGENMRIRWSMQQSKQFSEANVHSSRFKNPIECHVIEAETMNVTSLQAIRSWLHVICGHLLPSASFIFVYNSK